MRLIFFLKNVLSINQLDAAMHRHMRHGLRKGFLAEGWKNGEVGYFKQRVSCNRDGYFLPFREFEEKAREKIQAQNK